MQYVHTDVANQLVIMDPPISKIDKSLLGMELGSFGNVSFIVGSLLVDHIQGDGSKQTTFDCSFMLAKLAAQELPFTYPECAGAVVEPEHISALIALTLVKSRAERGLAKPEVDLDGSVMVYNQATKQVIGWGVEPPRLR